jgi:hypothetical protein
MVSEEQLDQLTQLDALLKAGEVQQASTLALKIAADAKAAAIAAGDLAPEPDVPRKPQEVVFDLITCIVAHLGNRPDLVALVAELKSLAPK